MVRECRKHGSVHHYPRLPSGWRCRDCATEAVRKRSRKVKRTLVQERGGRCEVCHYDKSLRALAFHHLDPEAKSFTISGGSVSIARQRAEADKCKLLCANCHAEAEDAVQVTREAATL